MDPKVHKIVAPLGADEIRNLVRKVSNKPKRDALENTLKDMKPGDVISSDKLLVLSQGITLSRKEQMRLVLAISNLPSQQTAEYGCNEPCPGCTKDLAKPGNVVTIVFTKKGGELLEIGGELKAIDDGVVPALVKSGVPIKTIPDDVELSFNQIPEKIEGLDLRNL